MDPALDSDLHDLLPVNRPEILAALPEVQARERCKFYLMLTAVGWDSDDAWGAALSLDPLLITEIKHAAKVVPDGVIRDAVMARRSHEPSDPLLLYHRAAINGFLKPAPSRISITIAGRR
jgi:hypothetical protein